MDENKNKLENVLTSEKNRALRCLNCYSKVVKTRVDGTTKKPLYFETWECRKQNKIKLKLFLVAFNVSSFTTEDTSKCEEYFKQFDKC
jgi:hypothetical protein